MVFVTVLQTGHVSHCDFNVISRDFLIQFHTISKAYPLYMNLAVSAGLVSYGLLQDGKRQTLLTLTDGDVSCYKKAPVGVIIWNILPRKTSGK